MCRECRVITGKCDECKLVLKLLTRRLSHDLALYTVRFIEGDSVLPMIRTRTKRGLNGERFLYEVELDIITRFIRIRHSEAVWWIERHEDIEVLRVERDVFYYCSRLDNTL